MGLSRLFSAISAIWLTVALTGASAYAATDDATDESSAIAGFERVVEFVAGSPLSEAERASVAAETQAQMRGNAADVARSEKSMRKLLADLAKGDVWERGEQRETLRFQIELLPASDPVRRIVDRHDPPLLLDAPQKRLITETTLRSWKEACVWMASMLGAPAPSSEFFAKQRAFLKTEYAALPSARQDAVAHVERNYPASVEVFSAVGPEKRAAFVREAKSRGLDRGDFDLKVADTVAAGYTYAINSILEMSIVLHGAANYNMLYHNSYRHI